MTRTASSVRDPDLDEFEQRLEFSKHALDDELVNHANLYFRVAERAEEKAAEVARAKQHLKVRESQIYLDLKTGGDKLSETQIKAMVETEGEIRDLNADISELSLQARRWEALREAYSQRRYNLGKVADLYSSAYYSNDDTVRRASDRVTTRRAEDVERRIRDEHNARGANDATRSGSVTQDRPQTTTRRRLRED